MSGVFSKDRKDYDISDFAKITLSERFDGYGTITFYTEYSWYDSIGLKPNWKPNMPEFNLILDAREVYDIIQSQVQA